MTKDKAVKKTDFEVRPEDLIDDSRMPSPESVTSFPPTPEEDELIRQSLKELLNSKFGFNL